MRTSPHRLIILIAGNFFIPILLGGFIFGVVLAFIIMSGGGAKANPSPAEIVQGVAFTAIMSAIFSLLMFFIPGLLYSLAISLLSLRRSPRRRPYIVGFAFVSGLTLFPSQVWFGNSGFDEFAWIVALISGPLFVATALFMVAVSGPGFPFREDITRPPPLPPGNFQ